MVPDWHIVRTNRCSRSNQCRGIEETTSINAVELARLSCASTNTDPGSPASKLPCKGGGAFFKKKKCISKLTEKLYL